MARRHRGRPVPQPVRPLPALTRTTPRRAVALGCGLGGGESQAAERVCSFFELVVRRRMVNHAVVPLWGRRGQRAYVSWQALVSPV